MRHSQVFVIVVEAVQACSVNVDVVGIIDTKTLSIAGSWMAMAELDTRTVEAHDRRKWLL